MVAAFPFAANGRAMTLESTDGFVRVVARRDNHLIVGWQAVGKGVSELAAAFSQSLEMGARLEDVAGTIRTEERRVGKECVSTCRYRWAPETKKKKNKRRN